MATTRESLIEEIIANARRDRKRLEAVADGLAHGLQQFAEGEQESDDFDSNVAAAYAEEISGVADSLTRCNQQLVELLKVESKRAPADKPLKLDSDEVENVFDEIQPEEQPN